MSLGIPSVLAHTQDAAEDRSARESAAYDEGRVWEVSHQWHVRMKHVLFGPNTMRAEELFASLMRERANGGAVLDVGCGTGVLTAELHSMGARSVYGFDVSAGEIDKARKDHGALPGVTFGVQSADAPIEGEFDLIVGRSILHHVDFRHILPAMYRRNLRPGGRMLFMEPMSHPLTLLFHRLVRSAHTADEWPLRPSDATWLRRELGARIRPVNLLSFPAGAVSSLVMPSPDNALMRAADRVDQAVERRSRVASRGRQGLILIDRPAEA